MAMKNPCHPGELIKEAIEDGLGWTITDAAAGLGVSRKTLSKIVNRRAGISPEMAVRLEAGIGSTAEHWLRLQMAFDLANTRRARGRIKVKKLVPA